MSDIREAFEKVGFKSSTPTQHQNSNAQHGGARFVLESNYAEQADRIIQEYKKAMGNRFELFTTSKIRKLLAMVSEIYNDVRTEPSNKLSQVMQNRIEYLKVRLVYECGRDSKDRVVRPFVDRTGLLDLLNDIGDNKRKFIDFARYMEALVAYHRFHGGKDEARR